MMRTSKKSFPGKTWLKKLIDRKIIHLQILCRTFPSPKIMQVRGNKLPSLTPKLKRQLSTRLYRLSKLYFKDCLRETTFTLVWEHLNWGKLLNNRINILWLRRAHSTTLLKLKITKEATLTYQPTITLKTDL
jgi:hypothetical protein